MQFNAPYHRNDRTWLFKWGGIGCEGHRNFRTIAKHSLRELAFLRLILRNCWEILRFKSFNFRIYFVCTKF